MGGPSTSRVPNNLTAPQPGLTGSSLGLLGQIFGNGSGSGGGGGGQNPFGNVNFNNLGGGFSGLNQQVQNAYGSQPGAGQGLGGNIGQNVSKAFGTSPLNQAVAGQFQSNLGNPLGQGLGLYQQGQNLLGQANQNLGQYLNPNQAAQGALAAYQPQYQTAVGFANDQGPRFSSGNDLLKSQALNNYNLFAQNVLNNTRQQGLQAAVAQGGLGQTAGQLGLGAGNLQNQATSAAGAFGNEQSGQQNQLIQQLLGALFQGGGVNTPAVLNQQPGFGQQLLGLAGTIGGMALGGGLGGAAGGLASGIGGGGDYSQLPFGAANTPPVSFNPFPTGAPPLQY